MKKRLVILSDIWGLDDSDWISMYVTELSKVADVQLYNSQELGGVTSHAKDMEIIHEQFVKEGIQLASHRLLEREVGEVFVLGFSIGGTIAWKAAQLGLNAAYLGLISSTRLRFETQKPNAKIDVIFAGNDPKMPGAQWFEKFDLRQEIFIGEEHDFYRKEDCAFQIIERIRKSLGV